jgi:protein tyrosine kinase modulator
MLQTYRASPEAFADDNANNVGLTHYIAIAKRRWLYFLVPFVILFLLASSLIAIQRPLYEAEGKILVETQDIPADLVKPTITDTANQRIQVIQQRITTRDNLLQIVKKFNLFPAEQQWMTTSQIFDLMKQRTQLKLVDLGLPMQQGNLTIAFTLSFEYENPDLAARVANEFLTLILNEDARNRTRRAEETTKFLEQEHKRLQGVLAALDLKIAEESLKPRDPAQDVPLVVRQQQEELTKLKLELVHKSAIYSNAHPEVVALKRRIAGLQKVIAETPPPPKPTQKADQNLDNLKQQRLSTTAALEDADRKLSAARLGESLERNQESERLQVIEQPVVPQKPVKPNRPKLLALAFALALMAGAGTVMAAEALDRSIHGMEDLTRIFDSSLIVAIPYISTDEEARRKRGRRRLLLGGILLIVLSALGAALYLGLTMDLSTWAARSWLEQLTRLSK